MLWLMAAGMSTMAASAENSGSHNPVILFMAGDVMTGRGIDQVLPHPGYPQLHEPYVKDARRYVELAEMIHGPLDKPVSCEYIWGDALTAWTRMAPDLRLINLETSITTSKEHWPGKDIHYKMHPENITCLNEAGIDYCSLANNHVLDWGHAGLTETLASLAKANIRISGAGTNLEQAERPAILPVNGKGRVIVFSYGLRSSGVPSDWAATPGRAGVNYLSALSTAGLKQIKARAEAIKQNSDIVVVSLHWGSNWGYAIPREHVEFAHRLIDEAGVDVIYGHSSHHPRPMEVYRGKLIVYGAGDFINDYEGISSHESFRGDLVLMYFASIDPVTGKLVQLQMLPMQIRQFRLQRASASDALWLLDTLNQEGKVFNTRLQLGDDNVLTLAIEKQPAINVHRPD